MSVMVQLCFFRSITFLVTHVRHSVLLAREEAQSLRISSAQVVAVSGNGASAQNATSTSSRFCVHAVETGAVWTQVLQSAGDVVAIQSLKNDSKHSAGPDHATHEETRNATTRRI